MCNITPARTTATTWEGGGSKLDTGLILMTTFYFGSLKHSFISHIVHMFSFIIFYILARSHILITIPLFRGQLLGSLVKR